MVLIASACALVLLSEWVVVGMGKANGATKPAEILTLSRSATLWSLVENDPSFPRCPNTASPRWHSPNERVGEVRYIK